MQRSKRRKLARQTAAGKVPMAAQVTRIHPYLNATEARVAGKFRTLAEALGPIQRAATR